MNLNFALNFVPQIRFVYSQNQNNKKKELSADLGIISKMAKPRKFPSDIQKYFIITKILKQCDLESQGRLLSVVSDHSEAERNQATQDQNSFENFFIRIYLQVLTQQKMTLNIISKQPSYYSLIKILLFPLLMIQHYTFNGFGETTSQKYADEPNLLKKTKKTSVMINNNIVEKL